MRLVRPRVVPAAGAPPTVYQLFPSDVPTGGGDVGNDVGSPVSVGVEFIVTAAAQLTAIRWWQPNTTNDASSRDVALYEVTGLTTGTLVASGPSAAPVGTGWQVATFSSPPTLGTFAGDGKTYRAVVYHPNGGYPATGSYWASGNGAAGITTGPLTAPNATNAVNSCQGSFNYAGSGISFPDEGFGGGNYWVDVSVVAL